MRKCRHGSSNDIYQGIYVDGVSNSVIRGAVAMSAAAATCEFVYPSEPAGMIADVRIEDADVGIMIARSAHITVSGVDIAARSELMMDLPSMIYNLPRPPASLTRNRRARAACRLTRFLTKR
jgi:hypothetical protein